MIACPVCGGKTSVAETRMMGTDKVRRRRLCLNMKCTGKVTTIETVVRTTPRATSILVEGNVLVSKRLLEKLRKLVATIGEDTP